MSGNAPLNPFGSNTASSQPTGAPGTAQPSSLGGNPAGPFGQLAAPANAPSGAPSQTGNTGGFGAPAAPTGAPSLGGAGGPFAPSTAGHNRAPSGGPDLVQTAVNMS